MSKIQKAIEHAKAGIAASQPPRPLAPAPSNLSDSGQFRAQGPNNISLSRIPRVQLDEELFEKNRLVLQNSDEHHPAQGAFRMLRTRLMQTMRSNNWRVLGITSIGPGEGKTYTSINLAISIAAEIGQEAILVDLDLRRPSIHHYMGIDPNGFVGIREYIENDARDLSEILVRPPIERLGCLLSSRPLDRSSDVLASPRGLHLFTELRNRVHPKTVVIVDLPPLLAADDALIMAPILDALLLVVAEGQAERNDLADAKQLVNEFNLIGIVLNKSNEKDSKRANYY